MNDSNQFVSLQEGAASIGMSTRALKRRRDFGELTVYADPRDRRRRLCRLADIERLAQPSPVVIRRRDRPDVAA